MNEWMEWMNKTNENPKTNVCVFLCVCSCVCSRGKFSAWWRSSPPPPPTPQYGNLRHSGKGEEEGVCGWSLKEKREEDWIGEEEEKRKMEEDTRWRRKRRSRRRQWCRRKKRPKRRKNMRDGGGRGRGTEATEMEEGEEGEENGAGRGWGGGDWGGREASEEEEESGRSKLQNKYRESGVIKWSHHFQTLGCGNNKSTMLSFRT